MARARRFMWIVQLLVVGAVVAGGWYAYTQSVIAAPVEKQSVAAKKHSFRKSVRRTGTLAPLEEEHIVTRVRGTILEMATEGTIVKKDDVVLRIDPAPHEDAKATQIALIREMKAEYNKLHQESLKTLNQAKEDAGMYELRFELETMRLKEVKKGPTFTDVINAKVNLENNQLLLEAKIDELKAVQTMANAGFAPQEEVRQKELEVTEQKLQVAASDLAQKKLDRIDPVKIADQELRVKDSQKTKEAAQERVRLMERNIEREAERNKRRLRRESERMEELEENIRKTIHRSPCDGVVIQKRRMWWQEVMPGRQVHDGNDVMSIPNMDKIKVIVPIDEARIARVGVDQIAEVTPYGWSGKPFKGKVIKVADKGRDEFENFQLHTIAISGTANRQVFDVEVEIEGKDAVLRNGLRADVEIVLKEFDSVVTVPRQAVFGKGSERYVQILQSSGESEKRDIKILGENELWAAVEGVNEGERVLVTDEVK